MATESLPTTGEPGDEPTSPTQLDQHGNGVISGEVVDLAEARTARDEQIPVDADDDDVDEEQQRPPEPVDRPDQQPAGSRFGLDRLRDADRQPIIPAWMRSADEARQSLVWAVGLAFYTVGYHATRSPKYLLRVLARSPKGAYRTVRAVVRWIWDAENEPLRQHCASKGDTETYLKLVRERDRHVRWRGIVTAAITPLAAVAVVLTAWLAPLGPRIAAAMAAALAFGVAGRSADKPLLDRAVTLPQRPRLTSEMLVSALSRLGISALTQTLTKDPAALRFTSPIHRDGPGYRADVDLPAGVIATDVMDKREYLAANLSRPVGCVWPEGNTEVHPGHLVVWVGDKELSKTKRPEWPLAKRGVVNLFEPFTFATDQRGRPVKVSLMFASMVIGAIPRMGKTFAVRLILLAAALDVRAQLHMFDLKGMGDFGALEPVAHRYRAGNEDEDIAYVLAAAKEVQAEITRRSKYIRRLPRHLCPENQITPELASNPRHGLFPIVFAIDETQKGFEHPTYGKELAAVCQDITRLGPAAGVIPIWATQRPDAKSLPTGISVNAALRFCLKVMGQEPNDQVLGTSAYKNGIRATIFTRRDKGIGILAGEGDDPQIAHTYEVDGVAADRIVARARQLRAEAGTLTGHALGEGSPSEDAATEHRLLHDIAHVTAGETDRVWSQTVIDRLAELRPTVYADWQPAQLATALKPYGIKTKQANRRVDGEQVNQRGLDPTDITTALHQHTPNSLTHDDQTDQGAA